MELSNVSVLDTRRKILLNTPHIDTSVGDLVTFNTDLSAPLKSCKVSFLPVQEGEGDPSPDNVRNIVGWNGVSVAHTNANLLTPDDPSNIGATYKLTATKKMLYDEVEQGFYTDPNTEGVAYRKYNGYDYVSFIAPSDMTVTFSLKYKKLSGSDSQYRFRLYKVLELPSSKTEKPSQTQLLKTWGNKTDAFDEWLDGSYTVALNKGEGLYFLMYGWIMWKDLTLIVGDSDVSYEDGIQNSYSVDWTDSAGTVYGGYVDLVSGELVQEWYGFTLDGINNYLNSNPKLLDNGLATIFDHIGSGGLSNLPVGPYNHYENRIICDKYPVKYRSDSEGIVTNSGRLYIRLILDPSKLEDVSSTSAIRESMIKWQQENSLQIVYNLETPIIYQLTPQQILAFKGTNNIFSDANGQTEIKYWKH